MELFGIFIPVNYLLIALVCFLGLMLILTLVALSQAAKANKTMKKFLRTNRGLNIIEAIENYYDKCEKVEKNFSAVENRVEKLEKEDMACIKKVGTLRYDAFREKNANLSFVAALLDESDNGFVLNGVYTRENTTTYLKEIKRGESTFALSDEEEQVIMIAKENYNKKTNKM